VSWVLAQPAVLHDPPFPVRRLLRQSRNAKSSTEAHNRAWFAWEVSLRLAVLAGDPAQIPARRTASVGDWARALPCAGRKLDADALRRLHLHLVRVVNPDAGLRTSVQQRELVDALVAYRNRVLGHGPSRDEDFCAEGARLLREGLASAWAAELFWPSDARLVYVESVEATPTGELVAQVLDLGLETPASLDRAGTPVPANVAPRSVHLRVGGAWTDIRPWALFDPADASFYLFQALRRRPDYIDFSSGQSLDPEGLARLAPSATAELERRFRSAPVAEEVREPADAGARRFGDYELVGEIGRGGMGVVHLANQVGLSRLVALKTLPEASRADPVLRARFHREIEALARCDHPNVVKIHASGEEGGVPYFVMEYVAGVDLRRIGEGLAKTKGIERALELAWSEVLAERGSLAEVLPRSSPPKLSGPGTRDRHRAVASLLRDAALGAQALHDVGIVHRDLSPANIVVTSGEARAVVMDLGAALLQDANRNLSRDQGRVLGTLRYMPPEQLERNLHQIDRRADVYALGAVLYELLSDRPIFDGDTEARLVEQVLREAPQPLRRLDRSIPEDLALIVRVATEKDPRLRYDSAAALAGDLDAFLEGRPIRARPPTPGYLLQRWIARNPALAAAAAVGVVGVLAATWLILKASTEARIESARRLALSDERRLDSLADLWEAVPADESAPRALDEIEAALRETGPRIDAYAAALAELQPTPDGNAAGTRAASAPEALAKRLHDEQVSSHQRILATWSRLTDPATGLSRRIELDRERAALVTRAAASTPAWDECRRAIAANPAYHGLDLAPQRALEPLRADPTSGLWEFWHVPSGARPAADDAGAWILREETGLVLVLLPGGAFDMGATRAIDQLAGPECEPVTRVVLEPYFVSKYEMTQAQWARVHLANPSHAQVPRVGSDDPLRPVEKISWVSARQTLAKLGLQLPTEAQWEYACRGGTSTVWASGDTRADQQAWANLADEELRRRGGPSGWDYEPWNDGQRDTCAVGRYRANGFGLHDVHGNVMEWVAEDCFPEYELPPRPGDGLRTGPSAARPEFNQIPHAARGGGWQTTAARSRSSHRYGVREPLSEAIGVRPARPVEADVRVR